MGVVPAAGLGAGVSVDNTTGASVEAGVGFRVSAAGLGVGDAADEGVAEGSGGCGPAGTGIDSVTSSRAPTAYRLKL